MEAIVSVDSDSLHGFVLQFELLLESLHGVLYLILHILSPILQVQHLVNYLNVLLLQHVDPLQLIFALLCELTDLPDSDPTDNPVKNEDLGPPFDADLEQFVLRLLRWCCLF